MRLELPQLAWYGTCVLELDLPGDWDVHIHEMEGHHRPALNDQDLVEAVRNPIGSAPLHRLAEGRSEVAILFDDMTRVTRVGPIARAIVNELGRADIRDRQVRFIMALGSHAACDRTCFEKKLGPNILRRFPVYNHHPFLPGVYVGTTTTFGTEVYLNEEVARCDLRIGIGSVVSHSWAGFGGGGKIVLPGVCSLNTIVHNHRAFHRERLSDRHPPRVGPAIWQDNPMRRDIEEAAELSRLEFLASAVVNGWGETAALYTGSLRESYGAAVADARDSCRTEPARGADVVIANTFAKANEGFLGLPPAYASVRAEGGDVVLIANAPDGQVIHYLSGPFGRYSEGPEWMDPAPLPEAVDRLIVFSQYPSLADRRWFPDSPKVHYCERWDDVVDLLRERRGPGSRVAVYPNADIQYLGQAR